MKKRLRKLALSRETLRDLSSRDAKAAFGAVSNTSCACRRESGCDCETEGCTITCPVPCATIAYC
jgi:hypothetical protein